MIELVESIAKSATAFETLEQSLRTLSKAELAIDLLQCGIIPEVFAHDSSEEKLWAKYCDILLSQAFGRLGLDSTVLRTRGNSADVYAKAEGYSLVGDAKAFRLSRTAKNQKDFKINALDDWRKTDTYACLVAPLYQFPAKTSQIYRQASIKNVTLLSYVHLRFLLDHTASPTLQGLWETPRSVPPSGQAEQYWQSIEQVLLDICQKEAADWLAYRQIEIEQTRLIAQEGVDYWQSVIEQYQSLSREEAIQTLIKAQKIEDKIRTIKRLMSKDVPL